MEFNIEPYNDDFELNAKDNNYLKVLFKPGFSVQARELTQIQSILQNQVKALGDHIFQDGSPVIGGNLALDNKVTYVKLDETYNNEDIELEGFIGKIILRDSDGLVQAKVLASYFPSGGVPTLMVKYLSGVDFADGDVFRIAGTATRAKCVDSSATGMGTIASINDGIFYVGGYFVTITPQTAVVSAYSQNANVKIGLEISDDIIDYTIDSTLLDPAQGSFNYQAPGADRYQFGLNLATRPLETAVDESKFFEIMRLENGAITKQVKYPIYSEIEKTLARRTFDESGDYTVEPFRASVGESSDPSKYVIVIEPGKAYVKGFEFETIGTFRMEVDKPRTEGVDSKSLVDIDFDTSYGNYLKFKNVWGSNVSSFVDIKNLETIDLHCVDTPNVAIGLVGGVAASRFFYANTRVGTAKVRGVTRDIVSTDGSDIDSNGVFNFYLTDITMAPRIFRLAGNGGASNQLVLPTYATAVNTAYQNTTVTVLPIQLTPVISVNTANVFAGSSRVNANSLVASVFTGNVSVGAIIRVGDETREVVSVNTAGDFLTVNSTFTKTIVGTDATTNPLAVYVQSSYASNVTGQTRIITAYNGSTKVATLDRAFDDGAIATTNTVVQMNFAVRDIASLVEANPAVIAASAGMGANAHANIAIQSLLLNGDTEMFEPSDRSVIFRLPQNTVKRGSLNNVDYNHTKYVELIGAGGVFTVAVESWESIPWSITNSNIEDNLIAVVRETSGGAIANGSVLKLTTSEVAPSGSGLSITLAATITKIDVYVNVKENDAEDRIRTKILHGNTEFSTSPFNYPTDTGVVINHTVSVAGSDVAKINVNNGLVFITDPAVTNIYPGDSINLYVPDVIGVRTILMGNTTHVADADNYQDITEHFVADLGQTDEMYNHAKLVLKQGYPSPNAKMTVVIDFYDHTYPAGASFFSVDSYSLDVYNAGNIPVYSSSTNGAYFLRDCLDFRPTRRIGTVNTVDTGFLPAPDASTELSFDYYLPRIDKLVLSKNKEFRVVKGISSPAPVPPNDTEDAMTLYTIYLPPFVATVQDIRLRYNENRRYTMKDISQIDKRVQAIEFYTALNNVENQALADSTKYEDGTDKAKYGIIGEGFKNFNIADYKDPDFNVSMEPEEMTPYVGNQAFGLKLVTNTNTKKNSKTVTLNYTEEPMISQPVTSNKLISVQPFLFASFIGQVNLSPEMDFWVSEELKPEIIRAPEIDGRVREILNSERITDRIRDLENRPTVPTPVTNAGPVIITNPGGDPPATNTAIQQPVRTPTPAPVIAPTPIILTFRRPRKHKKLIDSLRAIMPVIVRKRRKGRIVHVRPLPQTSLPSYTAPITAGGGGGRLSSGFTNLVLH